MIYSLNNDVITVVKDLFELDELKLYEVINQELQRCKNVLSTKGIKYEELKNALIPTKDLSHREYAFWFDKNQIDNSFYGREIMYRLLQVMDANSTYSILAGDYIDIIDKEDSSKLLLELLKEQVHVINDSVAICSNQYAIVYFNRLSMAQFTKIVEALKNYKWFYGYTDLFDSSKLKSYLSIILVNKFIKHKKYIILPNPDGIFDEGEKTNINILGYPFEENGYVIRSIDEEAFASFLSYKIETVLLRQEDSAYSINSIYPKFEYMKSLEFELPCDKWMYLNRETTEKEKGKGEIMSCLAEELQDIESFKTYIKNNICHNYIFEMEKNEYGVLKFCECIGLRTQNGHYRKTLISFKYMPAKRKISLLTIT